MWWYGLLPLCVAIVAWLSYWAGRRYGRSDERKNKAEEINEKARKAILIRQRLRDDDDYARRVRTRFTR